MVMDDRRRKLLRERNITFSCFKMVITALLTPNDITEDQWTNYFIDFAEHLDDREWIRQSLNPIEEFANDYFMDWDIENHNCQLRTKKDPKEDWITIISRFDKTLPEQGFEVLGFNKEWIDPDFNGDGIRVCFLQDWVDDHDEKIWTMAAWCNQHDEWHTLSNNDKAKEGMIPRPAPTHWRNKPEPPEI